MTTCEEYLLEQIRRKDEEILRLRELVLDLGWVDFRDQPWSEMPTTGQVQ